MSSRLNVACGKLPEWDVLDLLRYCGLRSLSWRRQSHQDLNAERWQGALRGKFHGPLPGTYRSERFRIRGARQGRLTIMLFIRAPVQCSVRTLMSVSTGSNRKNRSNSSVLRSRMVWIGR
jgi:hypothetical protein